MTDKKRIDPELRKIAKKIPYNRLIIRCANLYQTISFQLARISKETAHRKMTLKGYGGLPFRVDIFVPSDSREKLPCLIYAHGGAFSYKASAHQKKLACLYAWKGNCRVFFPDYHLTPKYPYPAAYEDILALYRYVTAHEEALGIDGEKIGVAGDSAGGCLAALVCNRHEREGLKPPCLQMLLYPVTDAAMETDSMKRFPDTPLWNAKNNRKMWSYYCRDPQAREDASPMRGELPKTIPAAYIETAEFDCLHDEGVLYGEKLRRAGAEADIHETRGTFHGYDIALNTQIVADNVEKRLAFLKKQFHSLPP